MTLAQKKEDVTLLANKIKNGLESETILDDSIGPTTLNMGWWTLVQDLAELLHVSVSTDPDEDYLPHINDIAGSNRTILNNLIDEAEAWLALMNE